MDEQVNMESEINHNSLSNYLRKRYPKRILDCHEHQQKGLLHDLIVLLHNNKFNTIGEIDQALTRTEKAVERFERENPQYKTLLPTGIVRMSMLLLYDDFNIYNDSDIELRKKLADYRKYILPEDK